jgi:D-3-phosphoglycerate dehydrogenase
MPSAHRHVQLGHYDWKPFLGAEIAGKTLGIVGTGAIGSAVAKKAVALGMNVIATTRNPSAERASSLGVRFVPLSELLSESDAITIHSSLNSATRGMFGIAEFARMKAGSFLVNTARSELVVQGAVEDALRNGHLGGAALDVIDGMPLCDEHIFRTHNNVILTPHCAFHTREALIAKTDICVSNIERFITGSPINIVN